METRNTLCLALKTASLHGQVDIVHVLLDAGADVTARDENGDSQVHFAVSKCVASLSRVWSLHLHVYYGCTGYPVPVGRISGHFFESGSGSGQNGTRYRISQPDSARSFLAVS